MEKSKIIETLQTKLTAGSIDRRGFMQGALATGMTVAAATTLADQAHAATPKMGGHLTVGHAHGATSDSKDPGLFENGFQLGLTFGYNGYLTKVGVDGSLQPEIAESWEGSPDATVWRFNLRDAEFHNGKSVTASDVIASMNHHRGEDSTSAAKPLFDGVTDIKSDGDKSVVVTLNSGNADFPFVMTDYHIALMPEKDGKMDWKPMVGCGAYKVDHYEPGVSSELSKFKNHWDDSVGHLATVQQLSLVDPNARTSALVSGDVDVIDRVDLKTAGLLGRKPGVNIHSVTGTQHYTFPMRVDQEPFTDANVRRALKWAINRKEMVEKILFGYGQIGNDVPIGSGQRFYNSEMEQTEYDPDKAKFYLKEAGLSSLKVDLSAADAAFAGAVDAAVLYQNSAKEAGIEINVVREPNDGYWGDVWNKKGWCACYWGGRPVEDMMFSTAYTTGVAWNDTAWSNERFDELLVQARAETDDELRRQMYYEMQEILRDDGGLVAPMFAAYVFAMSDAVGHTGTFGSNWDLDGDRFMERWWKA